MAAQQYFTLLNKTIVIKSDKFKYQEKYSIKFNEENFLHLTGVISKLNAKEFFDKCFDSSIDEDDFDYDAVKNKTNIKNKLRCLITIPTMFSKELLAQEQFEKNRVICKIATTDWSFTLGFTGGKYCVYPKNCIKQKPSR